MAEISAKVLPLKQSGEKQDIRGHCRGGTACIKCGDHGATLILHLSPRVSVSVRTLHVGCAEKAADRIGHSDSCLPNFFYERATGSSPAREVIFPRRINPNWFLDHNGGEFEETAMQSSFLASCETQIYDTGGTPVGDSDISGTGVIVAFMLSGYLTFMATFGAYLTGLVDDELLNAIDRRVLRVQPYRGKRPQIYEAVQKAVLTLSDQQIVTGIAVLGAGFQGLRTGTISTYHFQIVIYLAWLSSSVHLSCVTLLRPLLYHYRGLRIWRLAGMLILFLGLVIALVPTVTNFWGLIDYHQEDDDGSYLPDHDGWSIPAKCFWGHTWDGGVNPDAVLAYPILLVSYLWKIGDVFGRGRGMYAQRLRGPVDYLLERMLFAAAKRCPKRGAHRGGLWIFRLALAVHLPLTAAIEILASFSASLWLSVLGLVFGTIQILIPRSQNLEHTGSQENSWGFGQLTPLILLIQPVGAVTEHLWPREKEAGGRRPSNASSIHLGLRHGRDHSEARTHRDMQTPSQPFVDFVLSSRLSQTQEGLTQEFKEVLRKRHRSRQKEYLYTSRVFQTIVWMIQLGIAGIAFIIFYLDALTIGYGTEVWIIAGPSIAGCCVFFFLVTLILSPFSRLGRGDTGSGRANRHIMSLSDIVLEAGSAKESTKVPDVASSSS
nr:hypothetical protein CFP56_36187 [Quercus suber]